MSSAAEGTRNQATINPRLLPAIDRLLIAGIKLGPARKHKAINKILQLVPTWTRGDCWRRIRQLRKTSELAGFAQTPLRDELEKSAGVATVRRAPSRPWSPADDDKLLNWAGYEPVKKIAQRLGRSVRAVRFRLGALGMSAKVTDGWSQRGLRTLLRVSPARLRYLIGNAMLRVRDSRITSSSLAALCEKSRPSMDPSTIERLAAAIAKDEAHSWERVAGFLGVTLAEVQNLISGSQLKLVDMFVTDRSFEEFCRKHGGEINTSLMDPATAKWLASEYGVSGSGNGRIVSRAQKHALVTRRCKCGRKIAGNVYFKHVKHCRPVEERPLGAGANPARATMLHNCRSTGKVLSNGARGYTDG